MIEFLYKKKVIRDYLSLFTENFWKNLISAMLEYGIIQFKKHHNIASLTPEDIFNIVDKLKKDENLVERKKMNLINARNSNVASRSRSNPKLEKRSNSEIKSLTTIKTNRTISKDKTNNYQWANKEKLEIKNSHTPVKDKNKQLKFSHNKNRTYNSNKNLNKGIIKPLSKTNISVTKKQTKTPKLVKKPNDYTSNNEGLKFKIKPTSTTKKPSRKMSKTKEIFEQKNLLKLKEKNRNRFKSKDKSLLTDDDDIAINNSFEQKIITNNLSKVESKIKSAIQRDKNKYTQQTSGKGKSARSNTEKLLTKTRGIQRNESVNRSISSDNKSSSNYRSNDKYIGDDMNYNNKSSLLSLEERLNGLSQKILNVEKTSHNNER